MLKIYNYI